MIKFHIIHDWYTDDAHNSSFSVEKFEENKNEESEYWGERTSDRRILTPLCSRLLK